MDFDGRTGMSAATFYRMLARVVPPSGQVIRSAGLNSHVPLPWDAIWWRPCIDLLLFVHLVDGLTPGLYGLIRDARRLPAWRSASQPEFSWSRPRGCPEGLELYQLLEGDARRAATQLSLGQAIAGDSAFSLGMIAAFEASIDEHEPWFYRNLYWETGLIGQVLYLEAEAIGLRATGIGAYFDDLVHELAGFEGRGFQSLYHFTVGAPVEDLRITTLPSYLWSAERADATTIVE